MEGKEIGGHPLTSEDVTDAQQARRCHILFVSCPRACITTRLLDQVRSASVLTVGETPGFAEQAGIVNLKREGESVRIEVNITAAANAKLRISSKLLSLARILK